MIPPSASTSRTTVLFATPPMAGLHDIWPIVSSALVINPTRTPSRAAATAASVPAWPAPMTTTSKSVSNPRKSGIHLKIKRRSLEALLDYRPFFDECHSVFDSIDNDLCAYGE